MSVLVSEKRSTSSAAVRGANLSPEQHASMVLGIVKRRPIKSVATSDLPRYISMCEKILEGNPKSAEFVTLLARLKAEEYARDNGGRKPFVATVDHYYTEKQIPLKASKALRVISRIVAKFSELIKFDANDKEMANAVFMLEYTTMEALRAFEGATAGTRKAYLPPVYRHLLNNVAKNLNDPVPVVQSFTNDKRLMGMLDAAWKADGAAANEPAPEPKAVKVVNDPKYSNKVHSEERLCGKRATFHVYYEWDGSKHFDISFAQTAEEAIENHKAMCAILKRKIRIFAVVVCNPDKKL